MAATDDLVFRGRSAESVQGAMAATASAVRAYAPVTEPEPAPVPRPALRAAPEPALKVVAPPEPEPAPAVAAAPAPEPPPPQTKSEAPPADQPSEAMPGTMEEEPVISFAEWKADDAELEKPDWGAEPVHSEDASFDIDEVEFGDAPEEEEASDPLLPAPALERNREVQIAVGKARRYSKIPVGVAAGWGALGLVVLAVLGSAYTSRVDVVRALPATAGLYDLFGAPVNVRGLDFEDVDYGWTVDDGRVILEVRGEVVNVTDAPLTVPTLTFNLRNEERAEIYQWMADIRTEPLPGGESTRFVARIPSPPKSVRSLQVRFAGRG